MQSDDLLSESPSRWIMAGLDGQENARGRRRWVWIAGDGPGLGEGDRSVLAFAP